MFEEVEMTVEAQDQNNKL